MLQPPPRFYSLQCKMPRRISILLVFCLGLGAYAQPSSEFTLVRGELPIILVAPHGGSGILEGAPIRLKGNSNDRQFSTKKDLHTAELAELYRKEIKNKFDGRRGPSLLKSEVHRKYCDLNRDELDSSEHPQGRAAHERFHRALAVEIERLLKQHGFVLLLDIHGQSAEPEDLIVGTKNGSTIGEKTRKILWGPNGALKELQNQRFSVAPLEAQARVRYSGGYIVRHYSAQQGVEAMQLEHGRDLRSGTARRELFVSIMARALAERLRLEPHSAQKKPAPNELVVGKPA